MAKRCNNTRLSLTYRREMELPPADHGGSIRWDAFRSRRLPACKALNTFGKPAPTRDCLSSNTQLPSQGRRGALANKARYHPVISVVSRLLDLTRPPTDDPSYYRPHGVIGHHPDYMVACALEQLRR